MARVVNPIPHFEDRHFIFFYQLKSRDSSWEFINAHQGIEIVLVMEGKGQLILDGKVYPIAPGTLLICQPFQLHHYKIEAKYIRTPLVFDPYTFEHYTLPFPSLHALFYKLWKGHLEEQVFVLSEAELAAFDHIYRTFHERLQHSSEFGQQEELGLLLIDFLRELRKLYSSQPRVESSELRLREGNHIEQMMSWIEAHYQEDFSLDRLAQSLHLSSFYISHLFRQETGCSISQYIMARRIREACLLLTMTDLPIAQIGQNVGFNSSAYFCKQFKRKMGVSPQAFRKRSN